MCDDEICWWKEVKFPIQLHSDETLVGGIAIDITTRRQAEEALNERLRFEKLLSDLSSRFVKINGVIASPLGAEALWRL